jgi:hypothetical protein
MSNSCETHFDGRFGRVDFIETDVGCCDCEWNRNCEQRRQQKLVKENAVRTSLALPACTTRHITAKAAAMETRIQILAHRASAVVGQIQIASLLQELTASS